MKLKTFKRGVHPAYHKELSATKPITRAPIPKKVTIPLRQHIGAPCSPVVKKGDMVTEGQVIGEAVSFVAAPVHSSVAGKVKDVGMFPFPGGGKTLSVVIETDPDFTPKDWTKTEPRYVKDLSVEELRALVREAGIVGMGGATFPTSVKISPPKGQKVDTVVLNGCECEPYLSADHRMMVEHPEEVLIGLRAIMKSVGAEAAYIGVEDNKLDAIEALERMAEELVPGLKVVPLETKYPQGAEKMLIKAVLNRKVPTGKLPFDVGVVVNNIGTAVAIFEAVRFGKPLIERVVTVSGNGVKEPKNMMVRIGASFEDVIAAAGGLTESDGESQSERLILNGGPMMGIAQTTLEVPAIKGTSGITVLTGVEIKPVKYDNCIRCAACIEACPMALMPLRIGDLGRFEMIDDFTSWGGMDCIECGCCSFVCPSKRPLVQWIRTGKLRVREAQASKKSA